MFSRRFDLLSLCIFIFVLMFAIAMAGPVVPLYASSLGASWVQLGFMGTSWGATLMLLAMVSGRISDKLGRKPLLIASGCLSTIAALSYLLSSTVTGLILTRILEGVAWALFWPTIEALTTEIVEPRAAGRAMGMATASYGIAFATGSFAGGSITQIFSYSQTFILYLLLSLFATLLALVLIRKPDPRKALRVEGKGQKIDSSWRSEIILLAYFLGGAYTFGLGTILTFLSVFAKIQGVSVLLVGVLFGFFWVGRIAGSFGGGPLSDRLGRGRIAIVAMLGAAVGFVLVGASTEVGLLYVGVVILGVSIGAAFPVTVAIISDNIHRSIRGYAMGTFETSCAAGFLLASVAGGFLSDLYSPRTPYLLAATVSVLPATIFILKRVR